MEKSVSQIATSISQSKRLLAAGLDPESADMSWVEVDTPWRKDTKTIDELCPGNPIPHRSTPAWSLSRLIDILGDFNYGPMNNGSEMVMECIVMAIEADIEFGPKRINEKYLKK